MTKINNTMMYELKNLDTFYLTNQDVSEIGLNKSMKNNLEKFAQIIKKDGEVDMVFIIGIKNSKFHTKGGKILTDKFEHLCTVIPEFHDEQENPIFTKLKERYNRLLSLD